MEGCLHCHQGIEEMHPWFKLTCSACHGGNSGVTTKEAAHVRARKPLPPDERVLPAEFDPAHLQFINPMDMRVSRRVCGECHTEAVDNLFKSLHGTTAGHLSDGLYENGLSRNRRDRYSIFPVRDNDGEVPEHAYLSLPGFPEATRQIKLPGLAAHVADLGRKNCMQCHLWSSGTAVRGRLGQDGDYRGGGCAACHVQYADDGLSKSADPTIDSFEPGHPLLHQMVATPPTQTCTRCHYGDASIGLHFRGLAQLVPGMPAGPEVQGTTDSLLNGTYYINDPKIVPPDVHHEKGMHCVDCHTLSDVMGDGNIYGFMEHAVEIECVDCHGTLQEVSQLKTSRGQSLEHMGVDRGLVYLISKVDGKKHWVPQVAHVVDPTRPEYNPKAAAAMTAEHEKLECYSCHAGWNVNFFGFHFDRNESFTDLDLLSGRRTPGRCTTQEKVFATLKHFYLGYNDEGMIAPYLVGFSTMGSVHDDGGDLVLDQELPVTAAGLSGMTMIHHQLHSTRGTARDCVECHRAPATWGLGSGSFELTRDFAAVTDERGVHLVAADRASLELSAPLASLALPKAGRLVAQCDELQGHFEYLFIALEHAGVAVVDARNPAQPKRLSLIPTDDPRDVLVRAGLLYVADGRGGCKIFDVRKLDKVELLGEVPTAEARSMDLSWPYLFVADGPAGIKVLNVVNPRQPELVAHLDLGQDPLEEDDARAIKILFQYSRPDDGEGERTAARRLAVIAGGNHGVFLYDVTHLEQPQRMFPPAPAQRRRRGRPDGLDGARNRLAFTDVQLLSRFDLGSQGGEIPTQENDYAYFTAQETRQGGPGYLMVVRINDPRAPNQVGTVRIGSGATSLAMASFYNAPFLQRFAAVATSTSAIAVNVSSSDAPDMLGPLFTEARPVRGIVWESFSLDRMVDESGRQLKDISHEHARYLSRKEFEALLQVPLPREELLQGGK
jgi:hypothetical protein